MTGRQRIQAILDGTRPDRLSWTTLADGTTRSVMTPRLREMPLLDFYREIGCDVMMFGNWGLPSGAEVVCPVNIASPVRSQWDSDGERNICTMTTDWGTLTSVHRRGHPIIHPVKTIQDVHVLREIWAHIRVEEVDSDEPEKSFDRANNAIGDAGVFFQTTNPSPVQQLIQYEMGLETFYLLLSDHPAEMAELLSVMHSVRMQEYEILARRSPAQAFIPVENTSSNLTSPSIYRRHSLPQIRDYVNILHERGKKVILHMCGLLSGLLPEIRDTGADGVNALTPPPIGDCNFEKAMDVLGDGMINMGGILPGFQDPQATRASIHAALDRLFTPRVRRSNVLLWAGADGLATPLERFLAVRDWFEQHGGL